MEKKKEEKENPQNNQNQNIQTNNSFYTIIKHAKSEDILKACLLYCPYCNFNINYEPQNIGKLMTHIRGKHIKYPFPISKEYSEKIHQGKPIFENIEKSKEEKEENEKRE